MCRPFDVWQGSEYASEAYRQIMKNTRLTTNLLKISKYIRVLLNFILNPEPHHDIRKLIILFRSSISHEGNPSARDF